MSFQARHTWTLGATVNGAQLATCAHCETLRVEMLSTGELCFLRREVYPADEAPDPELGKRGVDVAPPCLSPARRFRPPE